MSYPTYSTNNGVGITDPTGDKEIGVGINGLVLTTGLLTTPTTTIISPSGFDTGGQQVSFTNLYNLKQATPALRIPATSNVYVVNNTYEANDDNLAKTRIASMSAIATLNPQLTLKADTGGAVWEEADLTQNGLTYTDATGSVSTASWSSIIAGGGGGGQNINQVLQQGQDANNQPITNLNGIAIAGGTSLYNNSLSFVGGLGAITDLATINGVAYPQPSSANITDILTNGNNAGGLNITNLNNVDLTTINNAPYPPSYSTPDLNSVLGAGNSANSQNITSVNNLDVYSINGTPYPPYPFAPYGLYETLSYNNNAGGLSMTNINNIDLSTINGSAYPPTPSLSLSQVLAVGYSAYNDIDMTNANILQVNNMNITSINSIPYKASVSFTAFNSSLIGNGSTYQGGNQVNLNAGTYSITYSMTFDSGYTNGSAGSPPPFMVQGYCILHSINYGNDIQPQGVSNGFIPATFISNQPTFSTNITANDTIVINNTDAYSLGCYFYSLTGMSSVMYLSATLTQI